MGCSLALPFCLWPFLLAWSCQWHWYCPVNVALWFKPNTMVLFRICDCLLKRDVGYQQLVRFRLVEPHFPSKLCGLNVARTYQTLSSMSWFLVGFLPSFSLVTPIIFRYTMPMRLNYTKGAAWATSVSPWGWLSGKQSTAVACKSVSSLQTCKELTKPWGYHWVVILSASLDLCFQISLCAEPGDLLHRPCLRQSASLRGWMPRTAKTPIGNDLIGFGGWYSGSGLPVASSILVGCPGMPGLRDHANTRPKLGQNPELDVPKFKYWNFLPETCRVIKCARSNLPYVCFFHIGLMCLCCLSG